jgi:ribosome-associated translation inhibitor RaiA
MPKSRSIKQLVTQQLEHLNRFNSHGGHCEVVVDEMHHWHKGGVYKVTLRLTVPGEPLYVACAEEESGSYEFLYSAIRTVFEDIGLQIKKRRRKIGRRKPVHLAA